MALPGSLAETMRKNIPPLPPQLPEDDAYTKLWIYGFSPQISTGAEITKLLASLPARSEILQLQTSFCYRNYAILTFHEIEEAFKCMDRFNYRILDGRLLEMGFFCLDALYRAYPLRMIDFDEYTSFEDIHRIMSGYGRLLLVASIARPKARKRDAIIYFHRLTDLQNAIAGFVKRRFGGARARLVSMLTDSQMKDRFGILKAECTVKGVQGPAGNAIAVPTNTAIGVVDLVLRSSPAEKLSRAGTKNIAQEALRPKSSRIIGPDYSTSDDSNTKRHSKGLLAPQANRRHPTSQAGMHGNTDLRAPAQTPPNAIPTTVAPRTFHFLNQPFRTDAGPADYSTLDENFSKRQKAIMSCLATQENPWPHHFHTAQPRMHGNTNPSAPAQTPRSAIPTDDGPRTSNSLNQPFRTEVRIDSTSHDNPSKRRKSISSCLATQANLHPNVVHTTQAMHGNTDLSAPAQTAHNAIPATYSPRIPPKTSSNSLNQSFQTDAKNTHVAKHIMSHDIAKESLATKSPTGQSPNVTATDPSIDRRGNAANPRLPNKIHFSAKERRRLIIGSMYEFFIDEDLKDAGAPGESIVPTHFAWGNGRRGERGSVWTTTFHGCRSRDIDPSILDTTPVLFAQWMNIPTAWQAGHCQRSLDIATAGDSRLPRSWYPFVSTQDIGGPITFSTNFEKICGLCSWKTTDTWTVLGSEARSRLAVVGAKGIEIWTMSEERRNSQGNSESGGRLLEKFGFEQGTGRFGRGVDVWERTVIGGGYVGMNNCVAIWLMQETSAYTSRWHGIPSLCAPYTVHNIDNMAGKPITRAFRFNRADDGKIAVVATSTGDLLFWNWAARDLQKVNSAHNGAITSLDWSVHQPNYIVTGGKDKIVKIWDQRKMKDRNGKAAPISILSAHQGPVRQVRWCPTQSNRLASSSDDGTLRIWGKPSVRDITNGTSRSDYNVVFVHESNRGAITDFEYHTNNNAIGCVSSGIPSEDIPGGIQVFQPRSMLL